MSLINTTNLYYWNMKRQIKLNTYTNKEQFSKIYTQIRHVNYTINFLIYTLSIPICKHSIHLYLYYKHFPFFFLKSTHGIFKSLL